MTYTVNILCLDSLFDFSRVYIARIYLLLWQKLEPIASLYSYINFVCIIRDHDAHHSSSNVTGHMHLTQTPFLGAAYSP